MTIRKRRRDRTRNRIANQKRLDTITYQKIGRNMLTSDETWGGTTCPECHKSVPARAFIVGRDIVDDWGVRMRIGTSVAPQYCHRDIMQCASESASQDKSKWKDSPLYQEVSNA